MASRSAPGGALNVTSSTIMRALPSSPAWSLAGARVVDQRGAADHGAGTRHAVVSFYPTICDPFDLHTAEQYKMQTVIELSAYLRAADRAGMTEGEREAVKDFIARNPDAGDEMPGTGGFRKLRWARPGAGKSGGYRLITFFCRLDVPVVLFSVYSKGVKVSLTKAERNALAAFKPELVASLESLTGGRSK